MLQGSDGRRRVIVALNPAARHAGLKPAMPITKAQALVDGLIVHDHAADADRAALDRLAHWAYRHVSPIVAPDYPDGLVIDTTGADHLHGGEEPLAHGIVRRLAAMGVESRIAIADSWGAAHALARFRANPVLLVPASESDAMVERLPVAALRLPPDIVNGLRELGFDRIGEIAAQPRAPMTLRFGPQLWRRLDQARGRAQELIDAVRPPDVIAADRIFAEPIAAAETIARYMDLLTDALCAGLEAKTVGALRVALVIHRVDGRAASVCIGMAKPVRDAKQIKRMLRDKIGSIDPGFGIEKMTLSAPRVQSLAPRQATSLIEEAAPDVSGLLDILANRFGADRFHKVVSVASDVPERSATRVPASLDAPAPGWQTLWRRPFQLLARPELIQTVALLPDHPPVSFTWRGTRHRVKCADGPERIRGEWWKANAEIGTVRDYFHVEDDDGENFWIFRSGDGERAESGSQAWFMHGLFA